MTHLSLINIIKRTPFIYNIYYYIVSFLIHILKLFVHPQDNLVLFVSYGGRSYDDSPKDIYEAMKKNPRFKGYRLVWAFIHPELYGQVNAIKIDTLRYYITALKARVWVTNVSIKRGLYFSGIKTFSLNTWHGSAIKKLGEDSLYKDSFISNNHSRRADVFIAQSEFDQLVFSQAFRIPKEDVYVTGFPRNDTLVMGNNTSNISYLKEKLNIPNGKKVILYAPTYRDYEKNDGYTCSFHPKINLARWQELFEDEYVLLIRAHMAVDKVWGIKENHFVRNLSSYPVLNDILLVTDILISDYSGIIFDFSILERPMICYAYDYDLYCKKRGVYFDIRKEMRYVEKENDLISAIKFIDVEAMRSESARFREKFVQMYGGSTQRVVDLICEKIME